MAEKRPSIAYPTRSHFGKLKALSCAVANLSATPSANNKSLMSDTDAQSRRLQSKHRALRFCTA